MHCAVALQNHHNIQIMTGIEFVKCYPRWKIEGNILQTEGEKFSTMIDTPVTVCFVTPQNQTIQQVNQ